MGRSILKPRLYTLSARSTPFLAITPALAVGILLGAKLDFHTCWILTSILILGAIAFKLGRKSDTPIIAALWVAFGITLYSYSIPPTLIPLTDKATYIAKVTAPPSLQGRYYRTQVQIICFRDSTNYWTPTDEQCLAYIDTTHQGSLGAVIAYQARTYPFDSTYAAYYNNRGIRGRQYIYQMDSLGQSVSFYEKIESLRILLAHRIEQADTSDMQSIAIMQALTIGVRSNVDYQTKQNYRDAGASHLLAISGLHIGIIFVLLNYITRGLCLIKYGRPIQCGIMLIMLWSFALISGMSPSVMRAVIMFTMMQIGLLVGSRNTLNNLLFSAFLLLLFRPFWLFDIGFQLSYLAMIGILLLYNPITRLYLPKHRLGRQLWQVTVVSFSAQLFTTPLVALVFGQISVIGLAVNLIVWITTPLIIGFTMAYMVVPIGPVGWCAVHSTALQNEVMRFMSAHDWAVVHCSNFPLVGCVVSYVIILPLSAWVFATYEQKRYKHAVRPDEWSFQRLEK